MGDERLHRAMVEHVIVAGGGVGAREGRLARLSTGVLTAQRYLTDRALAVAEPFGGAAPPWLWWPPHKVTGRHLGPYLASLHGSSPGVPRG